MDEPVHIQGRTLLEQDLTFLRQLIEANPSWHRTRISREVCQAWGWVAANGRPKDMACRSLLLKLEARGLLKLPARRKASVNAYRNRQIPLITPDATPLTGALKDLLPLQVEIVRTGATLNLFRGLLAQHHYLGYSGTVGENLKYLLRTRTGRPVACLFFGSAAWKTAPRDQYIGWDAAARQRGLMLMTNNMRFLVLPWVRVPHLASHILGLIARRVGPDWETTYGHPVVLLETFVDAERFAGTCYRAANWVCVGRTTGRSRNDREHRLRVNVKDVYLYPLKRHWRERLLAP